MITRQRKKTPIRRLWMPLIAAGVLGYFGYHAFSGSFGIWAMDRLDADGARLATELDRLRADHAALEHQVSAVRPASLDADVIDMEARTALNLMRPDEVIIPFVAPQHSQQ